MLPKMILDNKLVIYKTRGGGLTSVVQNYFDKGMYTSIMSRQILI